jgi:hypothetical protein
VVLLALAIAAYCLWPRGPSLAGFNPESLAGLQIEVWKAAREKNSLGPVLPLYRIFSDELHIPPVRSAQLAFRSAYALHIFHAAPDAADQEKALPLLEDVFAGVADATKSRFDPKAAARLELLNWTLRAGRAKPERIVPAWADLIGIVHGCPTAKAVPPAKKFAAAARLADDGKWDAARAASAEAWTAVKALPRGQ